MTILELHRDVLDLATIFNRTGKSTSDLLVHKQLLIREKYCGNSATSNSLTFPKIHFKFILFNFNEKFVQN